MADPISTIVSVLISQESVPVTQDGFGVPLILGVNASFLDLVQEFRNLSEVTDAGFLTTDEEYIAAQKIFSQNPKVPLLKIGKRGTQVAMVQTIVFSGALITGNTVNGKIGGVSITPVAFNTDNATTLTNLASAIQASPLVATAVSNGTNTITITAQTPGIPCTASDFVVTGGATQATATIAITTANHGVGEDLADIREEDDDWYGLILTDRTQEVVEIAAAYIETQKKIFITCSDDADLLDDTITTDIASVLQANNYRRTAIIYSATPDDFPDAAWMGKCFPFNPGSETWKFKTLAGIVADTLTSNQRFNLKNKNCNYYTTVGSQDMTAEGVVSVGEFIDIIRGIDWLEYTIAFEVFFVLKNSLKVPYTDEGITLIENRVRGALKAGENRGVIAIDPPFTVTVPRAVETPIVDRANRILNDVKFEARLAGAIHFVNIEGVVTV